MVQKIKWTNQAKSDLYDIYRFIARDSTRYAQIQIENIQNAVSNLAIFPLMGRNVPEFPHLPYWEILVGNYHVLYRLEEEKDQVIVMSVTHGGRLLKEPPD